ncbi:hypothetical protein [Pseudoalteromonas sp. APC 3218]|uniref:hypothetical protein n=1 Tax=Pseudoalteromonas sp. APC 3218 TaxID=3035180 RepID=UPI0025B289A9|nr:hypothetical protein [Pseudoalteromonas sp. APC 3218]MDN3406821.1 hypothetical protein [Pseudoalteromonas sp. APC 3218]
MEIWARRKGVAISDHYDNFIYELARNEHKEKGRTHCPQHVPEELHSQHYGSHDHPTINNTNINHSSSRCISTEITRLSFVALDQLAFMSYDNMLGYVPFIWF